ncbi:MAG: amidohydrolase/deacetylase family metallohydrolase [Candidatus Acidiferrum sp.]
MAKLLLLLLLCCSPLAAQQKYDLLIKNATVLDAKNGLKEVRDVAVTDHKIAAVEKNIATADAAKTINAKGMFLSPGFVDIHTHVYAGTGLRDAYDGDNSLYPDGYTFRSCVTTVADAGSAGYKNFPDFKERIIDRAKTRIFAFLNIVGSGMGPKPAEQNVADMDSAAAAEMAKQFPGLIVGIKTAHFEGPEWTAVDRALEAGEAAQIPVMVDFGVFRAERPYPDLVTKKLRPGDISTHMYIDFIPMLDENGKVQPYLFEAKKRGVIFDVGHGGGSFVFKQAYPAVHQGFLPDSISTDLHVGSMNAGMKDMTNVMSKFLNMGMPIEGVVQRTTMNPAREIHHEELGQIAVGAVADLALLSVEKGNFGFVDSLGGRMEGHQKLVCQMTVRNGLIVWDLNGLAREDWHTSDVFHPDPRWEGQLPTKR